MEIKKLLVKNLISYMSNSVSKKAFLEDCDDCEEINDAYDSGELTNEMFYNTVDELIAKLREED